MEIWLRERSAATSYTRYERAFRRMDLNRDGRIDFDEFLLMVRPIYNYSSYDKRYITAHDVRLNSPSKLIREEIADLKEHEISQKLNEISNLREEINESRMEGEKEYVPLIYSTPDRDANLRKHLIKKSLYADKYQSPAKKLAQEVREEILSRSMDRARIRALNRSPYRYQSPVKSQLSSARLGFELEESRKWWKDRYLHVSPLRYSRYYSPSRTSLELERIRDQRERERLRETLALERTAIARET